MISEKSYPLEVSALLFLHKIPFILCLGRGLLSVETSDQLEVLAARKTMFLMEKAQQSCPFLHLGTNGQNFKKNYPSLQNYLEKDFFPD